MNTFCVMIVLCLVQFSGASESEIVGGKIAKPHSREYMASLQTDNGYHVCGGFLIRDDFVLTAAHCKDLLPTTVVLGAHNLTQKEPSQQRIHVEDYYQHPKYTTEQYDNDIMLLKLKHKAKLNKEVKTIDLPKKDKKNKAVQKCSVAGWGKTDPSDIHASAVLRVAEEETQFDFECKKVWQNLFSSSHMICTKFNKKKGGSACQGDSGGPLVCNNKPLGIVSFTHGNDCTDAKAYHVYTKTSSFLPWIKEVLSGLGNASKPLTLDSQENNIRFN